MPEESYAQRNFRRTFGAPRGQSNMTSHHAPNPETRHSQVVNDPPVDTRLPPPNLHPGSHTTGGAKDHALPDEGDGAKSST